MHASAWHIILVFVAVFGCLGLGFAGFIFIMKTNRPPIPSDEAGPWEYQKFSVMTDVWSGLICIPPVVFALLVYLLW